MFYKKKGKPTAGDLVVCTVKKILYHSVFVSIDEYENLEGMIYISEIAPGRIRNLRDYVIEGKRIVCKVLEINIQGNINLSLRRAPLSARVSKINEYNNEEKAEKLVEQVGKEFKIDLKKFYETLGETAIAKYSGIYPFLQAIVEKGRNVIDDFKPNQKFAEALFNTVKEKIKLPEVKIGGTLILKSYMGAGVDDIKKILQDLIKNKINVHYLGAPNYKLSVTANNFKKAENILKAGVETASAQAEKAKCEFKFIKNE